jgi:acetyltransferase-like isoleucine patch superfamily enzyme
LYEIKYENGIIMKKNGNQFKAVIAGVLFVIDSTAKKIKYRYVNLLNYAHLNKLQQCGKDVVLFGHMNITGHANISIGRNVFIGENATLQGGGGLEIGDNVVISRNVTIYTMNHDWKKERLPFDYDYIEKKVVIEANVWIGMNVAVRPGVTIGEGAIVGMNSVILEDIPRLSIVNMHGAKIDSARDINCYNLAISKGDYWRYSRTVGKRRD